MTWELKDFVRRHYHVEGGGLDQARRVELILKVDGKVFVQVQAREPGLVAFVSRPDDPGFDVEIVEAKGQLYSDVRTVGGQGSEPLADWQRTALG